MADHQAIVEGGHIVECNHSGKHLRAPVLTPQDKILQQRIELLPPVMDHIELDIDQAQRGAGEVGDIIAASGQIEDIPRPAHLLTTVHTQDKTAL